MLYGYFANARYSRKRAGSARDNSIFLPGGVSIPYISAAYLKGWMDVLGEKEHRRWIVRSANAAAKATDLGGSSIAKPAIAFRLWITLFIKALMATATERLLFGAFYGAPFIQVDSKLLGSAGAQKLSL